MGPSLPIVQYWDTEDVPDYLDARIGSFRDLNPDMGCLLFDEAAAEEFIARHFGEREVSAFRSCAVPTMQSDFFRYCAVYVMGGVYVDVGFRCLQPLESLFESDGGGRLFKKDPPGYLLSGFFLFGAPGHPLPRLVLDVAIQNIERRASERVQLVTGPWILSSLSLLYELSLRADLGEEAARGGLERLLDPFCQEAAAVVPTEGARKLIRQMADPLIDAVGDRSRLSEAFAGVHVAPYELATRFVEAPSSSLPYKESERYWINWQRERSIFR